ncbi:MAG: hypothetical protein ACK4SA_22455 [Caldilinea sp.]
MRRHTLVVAMFLILAMVVSACAPAPQPAAPALGPCRAGQHGGLLIQPQTARSGITLLQAGQGKPGTTAQIHNPFGGQAHVVQALLHPPIDFPGQEVSPGIAGCSAAEIVPHPLQVEEIRHGPA